MILYSLNRVSKPVLIFQMHFHMVQCIEDLDFATNSIGIGVIIVIAIWQFHFIGMWFYFSDREKFLVIIRIYFRDIYGLQAIHLHEVIPDAFVMQYN